MDFPKKYRALLIFILFTFNNGFAWLMFDPVAGWLEENVHGLGRTQLELLSSWQPIVFLCLAIPIMKLVTRYDGLRMAIRIGASGEVIGACLKWIGSYNREHTFGLVMINLGQICSGIGSPVATGCVSALSATWFEPEERTRATAAAVLLNTFGNAMCYILVPWLTHHPSFTSVTSYEVAMAATACALVWVFFPQEPMPEEEEDDDNKAGAPQAVEHKKKENAAPAAAGEDVVTVHDVGEIHPPEHVGIGTQMKELVSNPSIVCIFFIYAWLCGGFAAWISLFAATYLDKASGFTEEYIGVMSFFGMTAYVIGGIVSSYAVDMWFSRQMKYVIFFCITMTTVANLVFIACTPNDKGYFLWNLGRTFIVFATAMCGFWNGAAAPLFYELAAEISFPVEESVSGICISISENLGALLFYQIVSRFFRGQSMSVAYSAGMTIAVALCALVKQRYNRTYYHANLEAAEAAEAGAL